MKKFYKTKWLPLVKKRNSQRKKNNKDINNVRVKRKNIYDIGPVVMIHFVTPAPESFFFLLLENELKRRRKKKNIE